MGKTWYEQRGGYSEKRYSGIIGDKELRIDQLNKNCVAKIKSAQDQFENYMNSERKKYDIEKTEIDQVESFITMKRNRIINQLNEQSGKVIEDLSIQNQEFLNSLQNQQKDQKDKIKSETSLKLI